MSKYSILYTAFVLVVILGVMHFIAEAFYLYWTLWWFDIAMHFLAGLAGGLIILRFAVRFGVSRSVLMALTSVLAVGIAWEIFEYVYGISGAIDYWRDTTIDLVADMAGAGMASFYYVSARIPKSS